MDSVGESQRSQTMHIKKRSGETKKPVERIGKMQLSTSRLNGESEDEERRSVEAGTGTGKAMNR